MADLITTLDYKGYSGLGGSEIDSQLTVLIPIASAVVRRYCWRDETNGFESASRVEFYDGYGSATLQLREWPVTSIASVEHRGNDGSYVALPSTSYRVNMKNGLLHRLGSARAMFSPDDMLPSRASFGEYPTWSEGFQNWRVTYTGGWATIPVDLKFACLRILTWSIGETRRDPSLQSESIGAYAYTRLAVGADDDAKRLRDMLRAFTTRFIL